MCDEGGVGSRTQSSSPTTTGRRGKKRTKTTVRAATKSEDENSEPLNLTQARVIVDLIDHTLALSHHLRSQVGTAHEQLGVTVAMRGVLRCLREAGPQTVPVLAATRPVSRQHIQVQVDALLAASLVRLVDNPAHKRSKLIQLTRRGRTLELAMQRAELAWFDGLDIDLELDELLTCADVLNKLTAVLQSG